MAPSEFNRRIKRPLLARYPCLRLMAKCVDFVYRLVRTLAIFSGTVFLVFATGLFNLRFKGQISHSCLESSLNSTKLFRDCEAQRQTTFLFIVFCVIRIFSHKWEQYILSRGDKECLTRKKVPGHHFGAAMGIPYLIRILYLSQGLVASPLLLSALAVSSAVAFFPFCKDFFITARLFCYGLKRRMYTANRSMIVNFILLYLHFSFLVLTMLDVSFGLFCADYSFLGFPLLFPNINLPLIFFLIVHFVTSHHKKMAIIVYEVHAEDCFIQLQRMRCLLLKDCPDRSNAVRLGEMPSQTTTQQRRLFEGRIVQVRDLRELETILPCSLPHTHAPDH